MLDIDEMKNVELKILISIDKICRENNIKYTLIAGSLLGAIRHKGFIPWDDDIDIAMTTSNYKKFMKIAPDQLPENLKIQNYKTEKDTPYLFSKVIDTNTTYIDSLISNLNTTKSLGLDIFPIYGIRDKDWAKTKKLGVVTGFLIADHYKNNVDVKHKGIKKIVRCFTKHIKLNTKVGHYFNKMDKYESKGKEVTFADRIGTNVKMPYSVFSNYIDIPFEGHRFMCIKDYDMYLSKTFGDYMTPPPENKRDTGHDYDYWNPNKPYKEYLLENMIKEGEKV